MATVFLSLGCNAGARYGNMEEMLRRLAEVLAPPIIKSRLMETEPVEVSGRQQWYLNRIVSGSYSLTARDLLRDCGMIENALGRVRGERHGPRTADIDILLFGDAVVGESELSIPHPGLLRRRFCLEGMRELAPDLIVPGAGVSVGAWYDAADITIKDQKIRFLE
jgi:2-amino-4-hydroxy-6-hydroxymethyldihydropteridine diphosphokinase